ncbi:hypothetical protein FHT44_005104 [Mycolicibacterium sp. BK634]|nr:hypothetical protein [Mycolicibacterium sp. BK634]MBB3752592.1 hypothetical protein [Mycolicibacterium sp. BK634]
MKVYASDMTPLQRALRAQYQNAGNPWLYGWFTARINALIGAGQ